jgi:hypothetical protein
VLIYENYFQPCGCLTFENIDFDFHHVCVAGKFGNECSLSAFGPMLGSNVSNGTCVVNMGCPTLVTSSQESGFHLPFYLLSRGVIVTFGKKSKRDRFRKWIILSIAKPWFDRRFCLAE